MTSISHICGYYGIMNIPVTCTGFQPNFKHRDNIDYIDFDIIKVRYGNIYYLVSIW